MEEKGIIKKMLLAGLGIYSLTKEKAQAFVDELVQKGEISQDEGAKLVRAMMKKADEEVDYVKKLVDKRVQEAVSKFSPFREDEIKKLNEKIDRLTAQMELLTKTMAEQKKTR